MENWCEYVSQDGEVRNVLQVRSTARLQQRPTLLCMYVGYVQYLYYVDVGHTYTTYSLSCIFKSIVYADRKHQLYVRMHVVPDGAAVSVGASERSIWFSRRFVLLVNLGGCLLMMCCVLFATQTYSTSCAYSSCWPVNVGEWPVDSNVRTFRSL